MDRRELEQLFAFDRWANRETLSALRTIDGGPPDDLAKLLRHTHSATDNWLSRIDGSEPFESLTWGPPPSLDQIEVYAERVTAKTIAFLASIEDHRLSEEFHYRNSSGDPFSNIVTDVLHHVLLHGVEHRAQIMYELGKLGGAPVELEYAWFLRDPPEDA